MKNHINISTYITTGENLYICPFCKNDKIFLKQKYCGNCGKSLNWKDYDKEEDKKEIIEDLFDMLVAYSSLVKDFCINKCPETKLEAEKMYDKVIVRLGDDDPRKRTLESLKELLND